MGKEFEEEEEDEHKRKKRSSEDGDGADEDEVLTDLIILLMATDRVKLIKTQVPTRESIIRQANLMISAKQVKKNTFLNLEKISTTIAIIGDEEGPEEELKNEPFKFHVSRFKSIFSCL